MQGADTLKNRFLETLGEACDKTGWEVQAYCLRLLHGGADPGPSPEGDTLLVPQGVDGVEVGGFESGEKAEDDADDSADGKGD